MQVQVQVRCRGRAWVRARGETAADGRGWGWLQCVGVGPEGRRVVVVMVVWSSRGWARIGEVTQAGRA